IALLGVLTIAGLGYILFFTSTVGAKTVQVVGARELPEEQILALAAVPDQRSMLRLDADEIRDRVLTLPGIATAAVSRSWPTTLRIEITERTPIGFFNGGNGFHLVDDAGTDFKTVPERPQGLPELSLTGSSAADPVTRSIAGVLAAVPPQLRER
ncbi:cell division protein FtsQ, partial [Virgibacillus profundi]